LNKGEKTHVYAIRCREPQGGKWETFISEGGKGVHRGRSQESAFGGENLERWRQKVTGSRGEKRQMREGKLKGPFSEVLGSTRAKGFKRNVCPGGAGRGRERGDIMEMGPRRHLKSFLRGQVRRRKNKGGAVES